MISALSDAQQQWVEDAGFKTLLHFELAELPQRLSYKVLKSFDEKNCLLVLKNGEIQITENVVYAVLGLPYQGAEIQFGQDDRIQERIKKWRSQFGITDGQNLVKASDVVDKIKQTGDVDDTFKMNFLVVMTNVLIRSNTNNFVSQTILSFNDDLDNCAKYNWAKHLIKSLVITKKRWMHTSSLFFTGPMVFLLVIIVQTIKVQSKIPNVVISNKNCLHI
ncbi:hypothetical protein DCAR_0934235 [Daucus carota subsp. sativus]|uniref:Aminotransferase-like plant mobile domain-containing protein n=1 Tax=Daucus carota subsp. sativus TaxID=79200 RepID=A0AAF0XUV5_DAUCS|nr:hypothetical protein DCAR_0934235 [Daucus carota subsp. sativus]